MRIITITQADRPHDTNQLHDELIAAKVTPERVESDPATGTTRIYVAEADAANAEKIVAAHQKRARLAPADRRALLADLKGETMSAVSASPSYRAKLEKLLESLI
jgi:hypothetical protein